MSNAQHNKDDTYLKNVKRLKKIYDKKVVTTKQEYISNLILKHDNINKISWSIINSVRQKSKSDNAALEAIQVEKENFLLSNPKEVASALNEHFVTIGNKISIIPTTNTQVDPLNHLMTPTVSNSLYLYPTNTTEITNIIKSLK